MKVFQSNVKPVAMICIFIKLEASSTGLVMLNKSAAGYEWNEDGTPGGRGSCTRTQCLVKRYERRGTISCIGVQKTIIVITLCLPLC